MEELSAIFYFGSPGPSRNLPTAQINAIRSQYYKHFWCGPCFLGIEGNEPVDPFVFHGPEITLVCQADLLGCSDAANKTPAAYIATLYERRGDEFAVDLNGTFAVILYDRRTDTLKAWTDHFGVQSLVYAEISDFLV